jgi:hypothetical protein
MGCELVGCYREGQLLGTPLVFLAIFSERFGHVGDIYTSIGVNRDK